MSPGGHSIKLCPCLQVEAALIGELGPGFLASQPEVAFQLQRCLFGQLVDSGDTDRALHLLRHSMAPIAMSLQHLQPFLKVGLALASQIPRKTCVHSTIARRDFGISPEGFHSAIVLIKENLKLQPGACSQLQPILSNSRGVGLWKTL